MSQAAVNTDAHSSLPLCIPVHEPNQFRALIVEDDPDMCELTSHALQRENIECDTAADGEAALQMLQQCSYDLLVTDLRLPRRNGHSLAVEALSQSNPPLVVVITGVSDPRLASDLYARGVSDFIRKPLKYHLLGPRLRRLLPRVARMSRVVGPEGQPEKSPASIPKITLSRLESRVETLERLTPISQAALEVVRLVQSATCDSRKVAAAIQLDPALAVEVLRLANSAYYNPTGQKLYDVDQAVVRIGHRRIGELAFLVSEMPIIDRKQIPWMNVTLAWQRSLAAGIACERLVEELDIPDPLENAFLCSLLHGMGRIVLATLFPAEYEKAIALCQQESFNLAQCEASFLPETPSAFLARLFKRWHLPDELCDPLQYADAPYESLSNLDDSLRRQVELIKLSGFLGKLSTGHWETWDDLELPLASLFEQLGLDEAAVQTILQHSRRDLASLSDLFALPAKDTHLQDLSLAKCIYRSTANTFDWIREILKTFGLELCDPEHAMSLPLPMIYNCLEPSPEEVADIAHPHASLTLTDSGCGASAALSGETLALPASMQCLIKACLRLFNE